MSDSILERPMKKCDNPLCDRAIKQGILYCCEGCARAHEGRYEIHEAGVLGHSSTCNDRHESRGAFT